MSALRIHVGKLVDGTGAAPLEDAAVLIDGERIVALGPDASVPSPDSAERLDFGEPRLSISGRPITMTGGHCWPFGGEADGTDGVREAVRQMVKEGADWIKIMATGGGSPGTQPYRASFSVEELTAAVDQAHALNRLTALTRGASRASSEQSRPVSTCLSTAASTTLLAVSASARTSPTRLPIGGSGSTRPCTSGGFAWRLERL